MTLLEITQDILSVMDGDSVNSIYDTEESEQVAKVVIRTFNAMVSGNTWYHTRKGLTLVPLSDLTRPTHIRLGDNVKELNSVNYDKAKLGVLHKEYAPVKYKRPDDFLRYTNMHNSSKDNILSVRDFSGIELLIQNDKAPDYCTSFDDKVLIFDSYDGAVESTVQESKVQAFGSVVPELKFEDDAVPDLPPDAMSGLVEEATSKCQWLIRQFEDPKSEQEAKRQSVWMARKQWRVAGGIKYRDYGRKV